MIRDQTIVSARAEKRQIELRAFQKVKAAMLAGRREADEPLPGRVREVQPRETRRQARQGSSD